MRGAWPHSKASPGEAWRRQGWNLSSNEGLTPWTRPSVGASGGCAHKDAGFATAFVGPFFKAVKHLKMATAEH